MRPRLKTAVTFTAGLLVGAVAAGALGVVAIFKIQAMRERAMAHESTFYLQMLSTEKGTHELRELLFDGLPDQARRFNAKRDDLDFASALWSIRLAYSMNDRQVPAELEAILANLPAEAGPRCNGTRRQLGLPPVETPEPPATPAAPHI
jgi:hypothetical protein